MPSKAIHTCHSSAFALTTAVLFAVSAVVVSTPSLAQTDANATTTSLERNSDKARKMKEPSFETRAERLKAKPLDWTKTIGKPKPRVLTETERKALEIAKPVASEDGKPDPKAEEEARRLHPEDWK